MTRFPSAIDSPDFSCAKNFHFSLSGKSNLMTQLITGTLVITLIYLFNYLKMNQPFAVKMLPSGLCSAVHLQSL